MLVQQFLENAAARLPHKVALVCEEERWTYQQLNQAADRLAGSLVSMGVKRQDRIVIFLDNSVESVVSLFGILKAGAIFIMLNPMMKARKLNYILKDSGAHVVIGQMSKAAVIADAVAGVEELRSVLWVGSGSAPLGTAGVGGTDRLWQEALFESAAHAAKRRPAAAGIDIDLAAIIYTSGSTGEPKGVMSAHCNMVAAARSICQYLENVESDIILDALPLSFDYGLYQVLMAFLFGGTVILEKSFVFPYRIIEKITSERATGFPVVPTMAAILLGMEDLSAADFSSLRYLTNTAAALPAAYIRKLQKLLPHVKIFSMYGLTECKRVSYLPPDQLQKRPNSVGIPMPNEEVFILDESGREVRPGESGELVVRGSNVMQGYWNAPEETGRVFCPGRYRGETLLYTGDIFRRDEEGYLYFVARKDDMIKTKGERVSPKEIESALCEMEGVTEAAAIGVPDQIFGQAVKVFVVTAKNAALTEKQVIAYCAKNLEPYMIPKYVQFEDSLPKSASCKVDKKRLREWNSTIAFQEERLAM